MKVCFLCLRVGENTIHSLRGRDTRGGLGRWKVGGVRPRSPNPDRVYDKAYKNFHTLFMISWEFPYPVYEIAVNFHTLFMTSWEFPYPIYH